MSDEHEIEWWDYDDADEMAAACVFLMESEEITGGLYNIGAGVDLSIRELAEMIAEVVGFDGELIFDASKPDGTPRKLLDVSRMSALGWTSKLGLREGIASVYAEFRLSAHAVGVPH